MKRLFIFLLLPILLLSSGCRVEKNGGFLRETHSGRVIDCFLEQEEEQLVIRLAIETEEAGRMTFSITDATLLQETDRISIGDWVEIDGVHWYEEPEEWEALTVTASTPSP